MKEIIVLISLVLLLVGIVWNYNVGSFAGTNMIVAGIVLIGLAAIFTKDDNNEAQK